MHRLDLMLAMMERFTAAYTHNNNNNNTSKASLSRERFGLQQQEQQQQQEVEVFITIGALDGVFVEVGKGFFIVREQSRVLFAREFMTVRLGTEAEYRDGFADMLYASGASSVGFLERLRGSLWA